MNVDAWKKLAAIAAFIVGVMVEFVETPPEDTQARPLAIFCVAVLVAISYAAVRKWNNERDLAGWIVAVLIALGASLYLHHRYTELYSSLTAAYQGSRHVIGTTLTSVGQLYLQKNPQKTNDDLLFDAGGKATTIWTSDSIKSARTNLRYSFLICSPLIGATIVGAVQVAELSTRKKRSRKR